MRDIVLIGGSSGAIEALLTIFKHIPPTFQGSILVVVHTTADGPGLLPRVLSRAGALRAVNPANGDPILPGVIYLRRRKAMGRGPSRCC